MSLAAQNRTITGKVIQLDTSEPLPGATIVVKGTTLGAVTDINGNYSVTINGENQVLVFSFLGYLTEEVPIGTKTVIDISMVTDIKSLDEIIVVGYGVQKKSLVTGSISKISGKDLTQNSNLRPSQILQGKVAGAVITNNSGQPGSGVSVRIRGVGTNGNNEPLYLVDGLPLGEASIDFINPSDIESIEVLKDAASTSIYGTRGANGVVLITTKKGSAGTKAITYDGYYGVQNPWRKLDVLNSKQYMNIINEAHANAKSPWFFSPEFMDKNTVDTDWQDEMFNYNAPIQNHTLSMSGGDDKSGYISSLSYFKQDGIVAKGKSNYERITYRVNASRKLGLLEVGTNINYANITNKGIDANSQYSGYSLIQALNAPPVVPVKNTDGSWGVPSQKGLDIGMQEISNPIALLSNLNSTTNTNKVIGNAFGEADLGKINKVLEGLKFRSSVNLEYTFVNGRTYSPKYYLDATHNLDTAGVHNKIDKYYTWNIDNVLTYDKKLNDHHITFMLGQSAYKRDESFVRGTNSQYIFNDLEHAYLNNTQSTMPTVEGGSVVHTLSSYFGRVNYDYQSKYMLTAIIRRDGSSRFGINNKYATFPSVSAGWVLSQEQFMANFLSLVNFLKVRASWGQNGNEEIQDFRYTSIISTNSVYYFGAGKTQYKGAQPSSISNPDVKWETSEQLNLGFDMQLFQNKINLTFDFYNKVTKDWLVDAPIPDMVGNKAPTINGGDLRNRGVEFELGYKNDFQKFHFEATVTGGYNRNKVTAINSIDHTFKAGNGGLGQKDIVVFKVGESAGSFYGVKTDGIFQNTDEVNNHKHINSDGTTSLIQPKAVPGDVRFIDQNTDGKIDDADRVNLGNPFPDFTGGLNLNLSWKGIDLSTFLYVSIGNDIWDVTRRNDLYFANFRSDVADRWIGEGTSNKLPRVTMSDANGNWSTPSDLYVKDGSFLRLRTLTLGYTIPSNVTNRIKIKRLRVYVSAENLLTYTKYRGFDPEIGGGVFTNGIDYGNYPQARTILGGINLSF
jgi:TonB-linked SusC/RagA family outer membrane protein